MAILTRPPALALVALAACAGNPEPGEPGYDYNVDGAYSAEFLADDGQAYGGTVDLATGAGGTVTGTMTLTDPMTVDGTVEGLVVGSELTVTISYTIPDTGCSGVASGGGTIAEGGGQVVGDVEILDECGGAPLTATFTFERQ